MMNRSTTKSLLPVLLLALLIGAASCSEDNKNPASSDDPAPPPLDARSPFLGVTVQVQNMAEGVRISEVKTSGNYGTPYNSMFQVVVGIDGCQFWLNEAGPLSPVEDQSYSASDYLLENPEQLVYLPPDSLHLRLILPSEDDLYPDSYPPLEVELPTVATSVDVPEGITHDPDTGDEYWPPLYTDNRLRFVLHRDDAYLSERLSLVNVEEVYTWTDGENEEEIWSQVRMADPVDGIVDVEIQEALRDQANMLRVTLDYRAYSTSTSVDVVEGKRAVILLVENVTVVRNYPISADAPH